MLFENFLGAGFRGKHVISFPRTHKQGKAREETRARRKGMVCGRDTQGARRTSPREWARFLCKRSCLLLRGGLFIAEKCEQHGVSELLNRNETTGWRGSAAHASGPVAK